MTDALTIEDRDAVRIAHLDDGKANAFSFEIIAGLREAIASAEADDAIKALVIHGRPGVFSGGFDLNVMRGGVDADVTKLVSDGGDLVREAFGASVPVVAACTGHAIAAGALLLLGCDLRVGAEGETNIGLPEVALGMNLPRWAVRIGSERLSRRHLQRAVALGKMSSPSEAVDAGFLDELAAADDLLDHAVAAAAALGESVVPAAYAGIVDTLRGPTLADMDALIAADRKTDGPLLG